jgi:integrase
MSRSKEPFVISQRNDSKTLQITLNPSCGLPERVCAEWHRKSFQNFPAELANYRNPKDKKTAKSFAYVLIQHLKKKQEEEGSARRVITEDITVGAWIEKFTNMETSPRTGINASKNRAYSEDSVDAYLSYYKCHIKNDPFTRLKMAETEEEDILEFITRLSLKKQKSGKPMSGTRTFAGIIIFLRMTFKEYQRKNRKWNNPFLYIEPPMYKSMTRDALPEDEMLKLFEPGVLIRTMELAVCAVMFLSGLRRSEIFALKPEDLDWVTPKITVRRAWQNFDNKKKMVLGPPKGKKERVAPFDPVLQEAIKKLWEENGQHEFVLCWKDGKTPGPSWIDFNFKHWLKRAGIELGGRRIVPHSSRHSLASLLEARGVSLRYIQELLGHSDLKTTKIYLHSTEKTIRDIGMKITDDVHAMIFSDNAPELEAKLHEHFFNTRINKINNRKEFFKADINEIEKVLKDNYKKVVDMVKEAPAEQYRESLLME